MSTITIKREFKISDGDYGNSTQSLSLRVSVPALAAATTALDRWELSERRLAAFKRENDMSDPDEMPNKLLKQYETLVDERMRALAALQEFVVSDEEEPK